MATQLPIISGEFYPRAKQLLPMSNYAIPLIPASAVAARGAAAQRARRVTRRSVQQARILTGTMELFPFSPLFTGKRLAPCNFLNNSHSVLKSPITVFFLYLKIFKD